MNPCLRKKRSEPKRRFFCSFVAFARALPDGLCCLLRLPCSLTPMRLTPLSSPSACLFSVALLLFCQCRVRPLGPCCLLWLYACESRKRIGRPGKTEAGRCARKNERCENKDEKIGSCNSCRCSAVRNGRRKKEEEEDVRSKMRRR